MARAPRRTVAANAGPNGNGEPLGGSDSGSSNIDGSGNIVIDPADITGPSGGSDGDAGGSATGDTGPKRRGRKPGSTGTRAKASSLDVNGLEALLYSTHLMLATITRNPVLVLDKAEAKMLAEASASVASFYDIAPAAKTLAWFQLGSTVAMVYGTRLFAMREARKAARAKPAGTGSTTGPGPQPADPNFRVDPAFMGEIDPNYVPGAS